MKCKNKEIIVRGMVYDGDSKITVMGLRCICTNDEKGKTLSIDDGNIQFTIPFEALAECFEGDYKKTILKS